jgi:aromatic-L-amino-acid decarboxylase
MIKNLDMPAEEFQKFGFEFIKWIKNYFEEIEKYSVLPKLIPGTIKEKFSQTPPSSSESFTNILSEVDKIIMPGVTHWNHPGFMAYFSASSSGPGILADILSSALNSNGMLWKTSPALTELEEVTLNWFRQIVNLPEEFWGIIYDTASVSTMHAIAAARENIEGYDIRTKGMAGRTDIKKLRLYCSEHTHSSIEKAAITLGIGLDGVRKIPTDNIFRMDSIKLKDAIEEDIKNGFMPFCVVATIGTTSTTSVDPVKEIAEICKEKNLWLHVDAAYAGVTAILPELNKFFEGWENADSIVINPHKWFFVPIDLSILFTKRKNILRQAFSLIPEYLRTQEDDDVTNFMDYGIQLGRRFRSLKLWFAIKYFGVEGFRERYRGHLRLGKLFLQRMKNSENFEILAPMNFSTICFRAKFNGTENEQDELNKLLLDKINQTGKIFLSHTKLNGRFVIRIVISGLRVEERHVLLAWEIINQKYEELHGRQV